MGLSPVELIIFTKVEAELRGVATFPNKQARRRVSLHIWTGLSAGTFPSLQEDAESAGRRHGRAHHRFLQLLWKRWRQAQTQQRRAEGAPAQRAHRLPDVPEGSDAGGENHERPGLQQRQRGGL